MVVTRQIFLHANGMLRVTQGNHAVEGGQAPWPTREIGCIYHVPIRSRQQLFRKAVLGATSNFCDGNSMRDLAFQKKDMVEMIGAGQLTVSRLRSMATNYPQVREEVEPISSPDLVSAGFEFRKLNVARSRKHIRRPKPVSDYVIVANALRDARIEIPDETTFTFCQNTVRLDIRSAPFADVPEMRAALQRLRTELANLERIQPDHERLQSDVISLTADRERLQAELCALTIETERAESDRQKLRAEVHSLLASRSWRITAPLRAISRMRFWRRSRPNVAA